MDRNSENKLNIDLKNGFSDEMIVHQNLRQDVIITTGDKLELLLIKNKECLKSKNEWIAPLGILIALITALATADFQDSLGLSGDIWHAIFIIVSGFSFFWLCKSVYIAWSNRKKGNLEMIIDDLKNNTKEETRNLYGTETLKYVSSFSEIYSEDKDPSSVFIENKRE